MQSDNNNKKLNPCSTISVHYLFFIVFSLLMTSTAYAQRDNPSVVYAERIATLEAQLDVQLQSSSLLDNDLLEVGQQIQMLRLQSADTVEQLAQLNAQSETLAAEIQSLDVTMGQIGVSSQGLLVQINEFNELLLNLQQQQVTINLQAAQQETVLQTNLAELKQQHERFQQLVAILMQQFTLRINWLSAYLEQSNSTALRDYIQGYLTALLNLQTRYVALLNGLNEVFLGKITQQKLALQELRDGTRSVLLAMQDSMDESQQQVLSLQSEQTALLEEQVALSSQQQQTINLQQNVFLQITELQAEQAAQAINLQLLSEQKTQLLQQAESQLSALNALQDELSDWYQQQQDYLAAQGREQKVQLAQASLNNLPMIEQGRCQAAQADLFVIACFVSDKAQIVRISHQQLLQLGVDLIGVPRFAIGALSDDLSVPVYVNTTDLFTDDSYIELLVQGNESLYSSERTYQLYVDFANDYPIAVTEAIAPTADTEASLESSLTLLSPITQQISTISQSYTETLRQDRNELYSVSGLSDLGWYDPDGFHYIFGGKTAKMDISFALDQYARTDEYAEIELKYAKRAYYLDSAELEVLLNGVSLGILDADQAGSGEVLRNISIAPGLLQTGDNTLSLSITNIGTRRMSFEYDEFSLSYQRQTMAYAAGQQQVLAFTATADQYRVDGFIDPNTVVYQYTAGTWQRLTPYAEYTGRESVQPFVVATQTNDELFVSLKPNTVELSLPREYVDITSQAAEYLVISHPDFIGSDALTELVNLRASEYSVQVVDVDQIYAQYANGNFDALAIKRFLGDKINHSGTQMVLLVGDDTYDYQDKLAIGENSYIPSMYLSLPLIMPADLLYVDQDDNALPDIAIGRLPVETRAELANIVNKTVQYESQHYAKNALLATNYSDGVGALIYQPSLRNRFDASWGIHDVLMTEDSPAEASRGKQLMVESIDSGIPLFVYTGHNSYATGPMFTSEDIGSLSNQNLPTIGVLIDSFTGFYVSDQFTATIGVQAEDLLNAPNSGAAAVFAPSSTVGYQGVQAGFIKSISNNSTLGAAYHQALSYSLNLGAASYNLLGDPGLRLNVF